MRGLQAICDLPIARCGGLILGVRELDALVFTLKEYLESDNKSTPPTKDLLRAAVLSLLQEGPLNHTFLNSCEHSLPDTSDTFYTHIESKFLIVHDPRIPNCS